MSITGEEGGPPLRTGNSIADINAGLLAAFGILAAYQHRQKTGRGQIVETSLIEAGLQLYWHAAIHFATGESPGPSGSAHVLATPYQAFPTQDGHIIVGGANEKNWARIAQVLDIPNGSTIHAIGATPTGCVIATRFAGDGRHPDDAARRLTGWRRSMQRACRPDPCIRLARR
jgi:crotonobetainyl-CoA:carnitine CoA-transferase CaiB-like acyl-CoA transferase